MDEETALGFVSGIARDLHLNILKLDVVKVFECVHQ